MSTLSQLNTSRTSASATYVSALAALKSAYIALAALDRTLSNTNVNGSSATIVRGFPLDRSALDDMVRQLSHAQYAPDQAANWLDTIVSTSDAQIAAFTAG